MMTNEKLFEKDFDGVIAFLFSEPGAMGSNNEARPYEIDGYKEIEWQEGHRLY